MREITNKFLNKLKCDNMRYYTIEDGRGIMPDVVTVAYFADRVYDMRILFLFHEDNIQIKVLGIENVPLYKRDALVSGINALYTEYKWLEFNIERNVIIAGVDMSFGIENAIQICINVINKISNIVGISRGNKYIW